MERTSKFDRFGDAEGMCREAKKLSWNFPDVQVRTMKCAGGRAGADGVHENHSRRGAPDIEKSGAFARFLNDVDTWGDAIAEEPSGD